MATGIEPLGAAAILRQHPFSQPEKTKKSPALLVHAASKRVRTKVNSFPRVQAIRLLIL